MQRKITLVSRLKRNHKSQLLWGAGIYCSSSKPLQSLGSDLNRNLWLYGCWEKGPPLVEWRSHTQVIWCCVPFFSVTMLYCFLYTGRALYSRAGLFHFRFSDLCPPASEILSCRTAKANGSWFLARRDIWNKIVRAWDLDSIAAMILYFWRPEICNNLRHLELSQVSLWERRPN